MRILDCGEVSLETAARALAEGKLVVIPTETVYGLGADAFNPEAVAKVFEAKARPSFDPLIVHLAELSDVERAASAFPPMARRLAESLWPGPLTLVLPKRPEVPGIVTSGLDTVALRLPSHPVARRIIALSGTLVAAPSANPFGYISPTSAMHVARTLGDKVDYIVDGGPSAVGVESTVLDLSRDGPPRLLRPGGLPLERLRELAGDIAVAGAPESKAGHAPLSSPGQLAGHYAPSASLRLYPAGGLAALSRDEIGEGCAAIVLDEAAASALARKGGFAAVFALSENGDLREAASRLFALLHELDTSEYGSIMAERVPEKGLGLAINDRLSRAARGSGARRGSHTCGKTP
ncbi:MAG TPA: L-threonylcarbamoyladenylate synthase [Rectinemataceae bacterium]